MILSQGVSGFVVLEYGGKVVLFQWFKYMNRCSINYNNGSYGIGFDPLRGGKSSL